MRFFLHFYISSLLTACLLSIPPALANIDYDIVYVRYPAKNPDGDFVTIPQGEHPYAIAPGADLIWHKKNGSQQILVDCDKCSVMDPFVSYDGKTIYYSLIEEPKASSASYLFKIHLFDPLLKPIQLTFSEPSDSLFYQANFNKQVELTQYRGIRDMSPIPLSDGRILFTSNRSALTALNPGTDAVIKSSVQQLYVMDDHDGSKRTSALANIQRLEAGSLHQVQHPIQLKDGRILFSTWQDVATKYNYAMTPLFTIHPDGTNLQQFTEPHNHHKMLEHFITQLANEDVISALYYPSFDYGYGIIMRYPIDPPGVDFLRGNIAQRWLHGEKYPVSYREFDRKGGLTITPHTTGNDVPAPNLSGKYSMPAAAPNDDLLVAYSSGSVNHFGAKCQKKKVCQHLKSGIYIIKHASQAIIETPKQLIKVIDDPNYNEIWPRAIVPYHQIYGIDKPKNIPFSQLDNRLVKSQAAAIVGTSSMYNRDLLDGGDKFQAKSSAREIHDGNWTIQGAEAGVFSNSDIYAVRIIGTPAKPFTKPINKHQERTRWDNISQYINDKRLDKVVARYGSYHNERWEILGEFPLNYKSFLDEQGNPDSSWAAKVPAETPFLIQTLDKNGMTLVSELTWRALKPGETRTDCGGCHAHSIEPLEYKTTSSGMRIPIQGIKGTTYNSPGLNEGLWDLTTGKIPLLNKEGVEYVNKSVVGIEFNRDVKPILESRCGNCHSKTGQETTLILDGSDGNSAWHNLTFKKKANGKTYIRPQLSKYIRIPQARQSLLTWVAWGKRLDGRTNDTYKDDIDYPNHPNFNITDDEKRTIARWIDLGGPIDFPNTEGMGYTDDNQLPIINMDSHHDEHLGYRISVGIHDVHSEIDWLSLKVKVELIDSEQKSGLFSYMSQNQNSTVIELKAKQSNYKTGVVEYYVCESQLLKAKAILITADVADTTGNKNRTSRYIVRH